MKFVRRNTEALKPLGLHLVPRGREVNTRHPSDLHVFLCFQKHQFAAREQFHMAGQEMGGRNLPKGWKNSPLVHGV